VGTRSWSNTSDNVDGERIFAIAAPPTHVSEECRLIAHFFLPAHVGGLPTFVAPISAKL
jgi:hypothetical protein